MIGPRLRDRHSIKTSNKSYNAVFYSAAGPLIRITLGTYTYSARTLAGTYPRHDLSARYSQVHLTPSTKIFKPAHGSTNVHHARLIFLKEIVIGFSNGVAAITKPVSIFL
jgi:hypothetical protein